MGQKITVEYITNQKVEKRMVQLPCLQKHQEELEMHKEYTFQLICIL